MESKKIKILAIDDNSDNLITIKALIYEAFENALIFTALSGIKGLELATTEDPDVILLDIVMPDMDGFEVCQRLKADNKLSDIPVVFVTALKGDKESRIRGLEVGAEAFLAKPIDESELTAQIRAMVKIKASNIEKHNEKERLAALVAERTRELKENHVATLNLLDDLKNENEARRKSEEALHASEVKFRTVADFAYDWEYWQGADNQFIYISPSCERISGYKLDEFLSDNTLLKKIVHPDDSALMNEHFKRVHTSEHQFVVEEFDYKIIKKDGSVVHIGHLCRPVFDDQGNYCGRRVSNRDITERKQAQDALRESEEKYRILIENANEAIYVVQNEKIVYANSTCEQIIGSSTNELLGKSIVDFVDKDQKEEIKKQHKELSDGVVQTHNGIFSVYLFNGVRIWLSINSVRIIWNDLPASLNFATDITERKQAEDALKQSEEKFREMANLLPQIVFEMDLNGTITYVNDQSVAILGYKNTELVGQKSVMFHIPEERGRVVDLLQRKPSWKEIVDREFTLLRKDGTVFTALIYTNGILKDNNLVGLRGIIVDITERKLAEEVIRNSEEKYRLLFANNPQPMWIYDLETLAFMEVNNSAINHYGYSREEFLSMTIKDILPAEDLPALLKNIEQVKLNKESIEQKDVEWIHLKKNGEQIIVELTTVSVISNGRKARHILINDITGSKLAEKELNEQKHFFEQMFMQSSVSTQILNREGWCERINPKLTQIFGVEPENIEGGKYNIFKDESIILNGIVPKLEIVFNDGQSVDWEVFFDIGVAADSQNIEVHEKKKAWLSNWAYPIFEQNGKISHVIIQHNDITERKQAEEALQKSEMFLRTFIENTPFEIWARDVNSVGILENKKMIDHFGSQLGQTPITSSNIEPEITQLWESNNKRVLNGEMIDEVVKYKIDHHPYIYQQIIFPIYNNEIIIGIAGFNIDITERVQIEEELKESQSLYFSFIEQLPNAVFRKDREGRFLLVNSQFCKLKGLKKEDLIGNTPKEVAAREIASRGEQGHAFKYANTGEDIHELILQTGKFFEAEEEYSTSNGDKQYMHVVRMPVVDSSGIIIGSQGIMFDVTERKLVEDALNNSEEQLKLFAAHLQNIREEERTDLAREIHDDLGQILVAMKIDLGLMKQKVLKSIDLAFLEDITTKFDNLFNLLDNTIKTTRRIMTGLRPEVLELLGFVEATRLYAIDFQERHNIHCKFESTLTKLVITSQQSVALFRILQEALTNVVRHAMATEVKVLLSIHNNKLIMEIIDNGIGFDQKYKGRSDSYGMIGMKERVFLLEGELTIKGETGKGTTVKIEMPYISDQLTVIS